MGYVRFRDRYRGARPEDLPWYHPEPDADLVQIIDSELPPSGARVVDLGAGPAVHAIFLAARGHRVTALDGVPEARDLALELAAERGVSLDYRVVDVLAWTPDGTYDAVFDRGFMHTLEPDQRSQWRAVVLQSLAPGGLLLVKSFDVRPPRDFGPPGLTAAEIVEVLGPAEPGGLELHALLRTRFPTPDESHATWTVAARRI